MTKSRNFTITLYTDSTDSWIVPWVHRLERILDPAHTVFVCHGAAHILKGDFLFLLGCTKLLPERYLELNTHNIVIHESALPQGKGWSPVSWQVIEGKNTIPVSLFEAGREMDAGEIFLQDEILLKGDELLPEIKQKQGEKTIQMVVDFLNRWPDLTPSPQKGEETIFRKRTISDDRLDSEKSLAELFNQLRIADNRNHPAWFEINGRAYQLHIYPDTRSIEQGDK